MSTNAFAFTHKCTLAGARLRSVSMLHTAAAECSRSMSSKPEDARYVLDQVLAHKLPVYQARLGHGGPEPQPGDVFVHSRQVINRWTDSLEWGTSRTRKGFRCYDAIVRPLTRKTLTIPISTNGRVEKWQVVAYDYQNEIAQGSELRSVWELVPDSDNSHQHLRQAQRQRVIFQPPYTGYGEPSTSSRAHSPPESPFLHTPSDSPVMSSASTFDDSKHYEHGHPQHGVRLPPMALTPPGEFGRGSHYTQRAPPPSLLDPREFQTQSPSQQPRRSTYDQALVDKFTF